MALSRERIADELLKLLALDDPSPTLRIMIERGILRPVLPEIDGGGPERLARLIACESAGSIAPDPLRRLAALLPRDEAVAEAVGARLRLSNKAKKRLICVAGADLDLSAYALAYRIGLDCAVDRLVLAGRAEDAAALEDWHRPRLPIGGGTLIKRGLPEGPMVARTLKTIEDGWVEGGFPSGPDFDRIVNEALAAAS
jgi:poly(A) polymerase